MKQYVVTHRVDDPNVAREVAKSSDLQLAIKLFPVNYSCEEEMFGEYIQLRACVNVALRYRLSKL